MIYTTKTYKKHTTNNIHPEIKHDAIYIPECIKSGRTAVWAATCLKIEKPYDKTYEETIIIIRNKANKHVKSPKDKLADIFAKCISPGREFWMEYDETNNEGHNILLAEENPERIAYEISMFKHSTNFQSRPKSWNIAYHKDQIKWVWDLDDIGALPQWKTIVKWRMEQKCNPENPTYGHADIINLFDL